MANLKNRICIPVLVPVQIHIFVPLLGRVSVQNHVLIPVLELVSVQNTEFVPVPKFTSVHKNVFGPFSSHEIEQTSEYSIWIAMIYVASIECSLEIYAGFAMLGMGI